MTGIDYCSALAASTQILEWVEEQIDLAHLAAVEERHVKALGWQEVDRPPIAFSAPVPEPFAVYPYHEAFHDPAKMLVNELVGPSLAWSPSSLSIVNSVRIQDDFPPQIRANYGVGLVASMFDAEIRVLEGSMPWTKPIGPAALKRWIKRGVPETSGGLFQRALDTMAFYKEALSPYPKCRRAIHLTQPDLQGPFDIAAQLWGGDIFTAFYDCPAFLREVLDVIAETYILVCREFAAASTETLRDGFIYLHFGIIRGACLLKDDTAVMLSPGLYSEFIRPANEKVLVALRGGGMHWCGSGDHWRSQVVETEGLTSLDWGNPEMQDLRAWVAALAERRLPVSRMGWDLEDFSEIAPARLFPTGVYFTVRTDSLEQAQDLMRTRCV